MSTFRLGLEDGSIGWHLVSLMAQFGGHVEHFSPHDFVGMEGRFDRR